MIGIRQEDKNEWERRAPLTPEHVQELVHNHGVEVVVQPSPIRAFPDADYEAAGARVSADLARCGVVLGVKEIPVRHLHAGTTYLFFAHVVKGQHHNMPMLRRLMELGCTLVDYEKITDDRGRRLIFFGRQAGHSGMIDTLWAFGQRLLQEGVPTPFADLKQARHYEHLAEARAAVFAVGERIRSEGLPEALTPLVCGITGYGHTYQGAAEVLDLLPVREIRPDEVQAVSRGSGRPRHAVYKVVFREEHTVAPVSDSDSFDLQDYYAHPEKYRPVFGTYLPDLTLLVNCVYWEPKYPRLVTKADLRKLFGGTHPPRLKVIGDISCDIEGSIECTLRSTDPGEPVFLYDAIEERERPGWVGRGPVVLAVDNLPCELPVDSSRFFGDMLLPFVPPLVRCPWEAPLAQLPLPPEILRAVIVHRGKLTPRFAYLEEHLAG